MQRVLNGSGTAQRLHRTGKLDEKAVAGGLEQPALMRGGERFDNTGAQPAHARQRAKLVTADHGGATDNIGRQDRGEAARAHSGTPDNLRPS
jgi:hypothetical protein